jgi:ankyrin repeat protein
MTGRPGEERDGYGRTPLHYAAADRDLRQARRLLDGGADPDATDKTGFTPLHFAAQEGAVDIAALLLERGASVDPQDSFGNTPLMKAVFSSRGEGELIQLLRRRGADPLRPNTRGQTPTGLARLIGNFPVARWFDDVEVDRAGT